MVAYRTLGRSRLKVSEIGLGCWAIGGPSFDDYGKPNGWSGNNDDDSIAGLYKAFESGINHWDTADTYGKGYSEQLMGKVFSEGVDRTKIILASKIGWFKGTAAHPFEPIHIRHQLEQSLYNLKTDYLDIYYLHNTNFGPDDYYLENAVEIMQRFKAEGKIRVIGQSSGSYSELMRVCPVVQPDVLQIPYNALRSPFDVPQTDIFQWADENNIGVVMFGTYAKGLLLGKHNIETVPAFESGDIRIQLQDFKEDFIRRLSPVLDKLKERFGSGTIQLATIANQYALSRSKNAVAIPGFKNARQVSDNVFTMGKPLSDEEITFIRELFAPFKSI